MLRRVCVCVFSKRLDAFASCKVQPVISPIFMWLSCTASNTHTHLLTQSNKCIQNCLCTHTHTTWPDEEEPLFRITSPLNTDTQFYCYSAICETTKVTLVWIFCGLHASSCFHRVKTHNPSVLMAASYGFCECVCSITEVRAVWHKSIPRPDAQKQPPLPSIWLVCSRLRSVIRPHRAVRLWQAVTVAGH